MKNPGRSWIVGIALFITLSVLIAVSLNFGAASTDSVVIWNIRLPRTVAAIGVGVGLGSAGVLLQGSLRNPLADPALVGVSAGAALGAVLGQFGGRDAPRGDRFSPRHSGSDDSLGAWDSLSDGRDPTA